MTESAISMLECALAYANNFGWPVFPCDQEKHPKTTNGYLDATTDTTIIREWWTRDPQANIGVACGAAQLVVVDQDTKNGIDGREAWRDLRTEHHIDDDTVSQVTPSGGEHLLYSANGTNIRCFVGNPAPGIDIRAVGGYILVPPSRTPEGRYAWQLGYGPDEHELKPLPASLSHLLLPANSGFHKAEPIPDKIPHGKQHTTLVSLAGTLRERGLGVDEIDATLQLVNENRCEIPGPRQNIRRIAESACKLWAAGELVRATLHIVSTRSNNGTIRQLPELFADEPDLAVATGKAWQALREANNPPRYFRHGGMLVRIENDDEGQPLIAELNPERLRLEMAEIANWCKRVKKETESGDTLIKQPAHPPMAVIKSMLATADPPLPPLHRIVEAPVFSPDGIIETEPGYHNASHSYYAPAPGFTVPVIPIMPTTADLEKAKSLIIDDLLCDFPFAEYADRANAIAIGLGPSVREMVRGPTPLLVVESPTPGTGKDLLVQALQRTFTGHSAGVISAPGDDDEWRKAITTCLLMAPPAINIGNVTRPIDSGPLASALTALVWSDRRLGHNESITVPVRVCWTLTANNLVLSTELARRSVRIRLDTCEDRPWLRSGFKHSTLLEWADEHRGDLVWAFLILAQNWIAKGRPAGTVVMGSFEAWSRVMGGILDAAGIPDFLANQMRFYEEADTEGTMLRGLVTAWWTAFTSQEVKAADLYPLWVDIEGLEAAPQIGDEKKRAPSDRKERTRFGMMLARQRDRVIGDYRIRAAGKTLKQRRWRLERIG